MNKSIFTLNDEILKIESIIFDKGLLSIKASNNCVLNIDLNFDITKLNNGIRENISKKIYTDQNFITEKYSYVIDIGNEVYLTKNDDNYLLEISISNVNILIPPFDNINNRRLNNYDESEINKLEAKIYFNY